MAAKRMLLAVKRIGKAAKLSIVDRQGRSRSMIYVTRSGDQFAFTAEPMSGEEAGGGQQSLTTASMIAALKWAIDAAGPEAKVLWYDKPLSIEMAGQGHWRLVGSSSASDASMPELDKD